MYVCIEFLEAVAIESCSEWDLKPRPMNEFCSDAVTN